MYKMIRFVGKYYNHLIEILNMRTFRWMVFVVSMWATIIIIRLMYLFLLGFSFHIGDHHVHHYAYGIIIVIVSGLALIFIDDVKKNVAIPFFGIGTGMVIDEYAFILASDNIGYSSKITIFTILLLSAIIIFIARYFQKIGVEK